MPSLFLRALLLAQLPSLFSAAKLPAASKLRGAASTNSSNSSVAAKNASTSGEAAPVVVKPSARNVTAAMKIDSTAKVKIGSTAKVAPPGGIIAEPFTGPVPKAINRHLQQNITEKINKSFPAQAPRAYLRAAHAASDSASVAAGHENATDFLLHASSECECHYSDVCECRSAMEFMTCVAKACASGACDCRKYEFLDACGAIASACSSLAIGCGHERAECIHDEVAVAPEVVKMPKAEMVAEEIYEKLKELKEKRCELEAAKNDGWLNADGQLEETNHEIRELVDQLATMGEQLPEMHCQKHFEEWHNPPSTPAPARKEADPEPKPEPEAAKTEDSKPAEPTGDKEKKVPLWSAPARSSAMHMACPLLFVASLVSAVLAFN